MSDACLAALADHCPGLQDLAVKACRVSQLAGLPACLPAFGWLPVTVESEQAITDAGALSMCRLAERRELPLRINFVSFRCSASMQCTPGSMLGGHIGNGVASTTSTS